ncbi:type I restriction endonuclease subunit R [Helicobacter sp. MIT 14-3879]|uniref:type I restriction endonuclease subunit R n=1 Tax=Helicobacter sp. MIT 14-3879 TaxID=2040649 RepID=UPI000E1F07CC|nr:type I restriction endonuclease subunit R [Helicobacter sp. MIT 14-3879]RDU62848.1 DEAD/DEAH box helicase [Helicobacter sp. MIT 14-3879]
MQEQQDLIALNKYNTIVANFTPRKMQRKGFQSEAELEDNLIKDLRDMGYEYLDINSTIELESNLKDKLERLNNITFSNSEWSRFYKEITTKTKSDKIEMIQVDGYSSLLSRDDGSIKNIKFIDKENINNNFLQVISQINNKEGSYKNRYDVSLLVNGLPLVHIELKKRGVDLKEAFNQIARYNKESFSSGNALFEFVHIFVISNGTQTKYYSNTLRDLLNKTSNESNHFSFCITFSDANNKAILDLEDFTQTFFAKRTLLNILFKYCVFKTDRELLVMRPYQIAACERILDKIIISHNYKLYGTRDSCGYIWHSTGSGKTLTSFKTSILATKLGYIKKVFFVVDRKDLDHQTMKEYNKYQDKAANSTKNTEQLKKSIQDINSKIIITTIQKLSIFIDKNPQSSIYNEEVVLIFDECHRSQFGKMHQNIIKRFKKYYIFGFTGTPIFEENAQANNYTTIKVKNDQGINEERAVQATTERLFGKELHSYTILNAIMDKNVLPFNLEYYSTMKEKENITDEEVRGIDKESALMNEKRIEKIVRYILEHFNQKTKRNVSNIGFNSIFATSSVEAAKLYYKEFKKQLEKETNPLNARKVGIIYSYVANDDRDEIDDGADSLDSKRFLEDALRDYNKMFKSNYSLSDFDAYYKNVSERVKNRELDILIVVNMFLTGFDSKYINTLWVDKNLYFHGLLQSFSRTNRILNDVKKFGNIVCFRNLQEATNESLKLFGDKEARNIVLLRTFREYLEGYSDSDGNYNKGYNELVEELKDRFDLAKFPLNTNNDKKEFISLFNEILKLENILNVFDEFSDNNILDEALKQDYQSHYISLYNELRGDNEKTPINDDLVFEIELIKQVEVNVEYILMLLEKYYKDQNQEYRNKILKSIESSLTLRNKIDLLREFLELIESTKSNEDFNNLFKDFIKEKYYYEFNKIIKEENLSSETTSEFMQHSFENNKFQDKGGDIDRIIKLPLFAQNQLEIENKRQNIIYRLKSFFERFIDLGILNIINNN